MFVLVLGFGLVGLFWFGWFVCFDCVFVGFYFLKCSSQGWSGLVYTPNHRWPRCTRTKSETCIRTRSWFRNKTITTLTKEEKDENEETSRKRKRKNKGGKNATKKTRRMPTTTTIDFWVARVKRSSRVIVQHAQVHKDAIEFIFICSQSCTTCNMFLLSHILISKMNVQNFRNKSSHF